MAPHSGCGSAVKTMDYLVCQQDSTALKTELLHTGGHWKGLAKTAGGQVQAIRECIH